MERKIKQEFRLADQFLDLRKLDTNVIVDYLEEQMRLREMPVDKKLKEMLKK